MWWSNLHGLATPIHYLSGLPLNRRFALVLEITCYLCGAWVREDQISVTRIPLWAAASENDPNEWKDTDVAMAFINDEGEVVTFCLNCALKATKRCWDRIHAGVASITST
jgi:hypothetical protein